MLPIKVLPIYVRSDRALMISVSFTAQTSLKELAEEGACEFAQNVRKLLEQELEPLLAMEVILPRRQPR